MVHVYCGFDLVLEADFDLLLRGRNDIVFSRAFESWKIGDGALDNTQRLLEFVFGDDERRCEADDILVCWFGLQVLG